MWKRIYMYIKTTFCETSEKQGWAILDTCPAHNATYMFFEIGTFFFFSFPNVWPGVESSHVMREDIGHWLLAFHILFLLFWVFSHLPLPLNPVNFLSLTSWSCSLLSPSLFGKTTKKHAHSKFYLSSCLNHCHPTSAKDHSFSCNYIGLFRIACSVNTHIPVLLVMINDIDWEGYIKSFCHIRYVPTQYLRWKWHKALRYLTCPVFLPLCLVLCSNYFT